MVTRNKEMHYRNHELERLDIGHYHFYIKSTMREWISWESLESGYRVKIHLFFCQHALMFSTELVMKPTNANSEINYLIKMSAFWGSHTKIRNGAIWYVSGHILFQRDPVWHLLDWRLSHYPWESFEETEKNLIYRIVRSKFSVHPMTIFQIYILFFFKFYFGFY